MDFVLSTVSRYVRCFSTASCWADLYSDLMPDNDQCKLVDSQSVVLLGYSQLQVA